MESENTKNKEKEVFNIGIGVGSTISLPIILGIFVNNIIVKIVSLIFLFFFVIIVGNSFEEHYTINQLKKEYETKKRKRKK